MPLVLSQLPALMLLVPGAVMPTASIVASLLGVGLTLLWTLISWQTSMLRREVSADVEEFKKAAYEGLFRFQGDAVRTLRYDESEGSLINATARDSRNAPRNVLLNNKTIQTILKTILDHDEATLEETGYSCGRDFGGVIVALHPTEMNDLRGLINEWFRYDSNAGFGRFDLKSEIRLGKTHEIQIVLHNNFLTSGEIYKIERQSLCGFMRGYIRGVFSSLPSESLMKNGFKPEKISVKHDSHSNECICFSKDERRGCIFTVTG